MKRNKGWLAFLMAGMLFVQSYYLVEAAEIIQMQESVSDNSAADGDTAAEKETGQEERMPGEIGHADVPSADAEEEDVHEEADSGEAVSQNSISENSVSENGVESGAQNTEDGLTENTAEDGAPENITDDSISENTAEDSAAESNTDDSVSENTTGDSVPESDTDDSVSENTTEDSAAESDTDDSVSENTTDGSVSENTTQDSVSANTMGVDDETASALESRASVPPAAPVVRSVVPRDTTAVILFTHLLEGGQSTGIQYEALLTDEVNGAERMLSGKETGVVIINGYDGKENNTFRMEGLSENKKYSVILQAKYGDSGEPVLSVKKTFTTKKSMLATDGSMKIRYADMEALKNDSTKKPEEITAGVQMKTGESCALYAQVSRLMRAMETDKLKWTVTPADEGSPGNGLKVKPGKSTYEAVLTAGEQGVYKVTATNTLSKEQVASFEVKVTAR